MGGLKIRVEWGRDRPTREVGRWADLAPEARASAERSEGVTEVRVAGAGAGPSTLAQARRPPGLAWAPVSRPERPPAFQIHQTEEGRDSRGP
jgi:hypothetical protein